MADEDLLYRIGADTGNFEAAMGRVIAGAAKSALGFAGVSFALKSLVEEALNSEVAFTRLKTAMENTSDGNTRMFTTMKNMSAQMGLTAGFTETQMAGAFTKLMQTTGSSEVAMKAIGPAMELARAKGMDLTQSAGLVARAYENGTKSIARQTQIYGENKKGLEALELIQGRFAGNVEKYANTAKGEIESTAAVFMRLGSEAITPIVDISADLGKGLAEAADKGMKEWKDLRKVFDGIIDALREIAGVWIPTVVYAAQRMVHQIVDGLKDIVFGHSIGKAAQAENAKMWDDIISFAKKRQKEETTVINQSHDEEIKKNKDAGASFTKTRDVELSDATKFFNNLSSLSKTKNKELFEIGKAASIGAIIANTADAIIKTGAQLGYPAAIPFQAAAAVEGGVQLAAASAASFNPAGAAAGLFADESMISTFQPREMVIPQRFSDLIASGRMSLHGGNSTTNNGAVNIVINGEHKSARQIALEIAHYFKSERGNRAIRADGSFNL
jgi:hypothetical protein